MPYYLKHKFRYYKLIVTIIQWSKFFHDQYEHSKIREWMEFSYYPTVTIWLFRSEEQDCIQKYDKNCLVL